MAEPLFSREPMVPVLKETHADHSRCVIVGSFICIRRPADLGVPTPDELHANACLAAAGPDLYTALAELLAAPVVLSAATLKARAKALAVLAIARGEFDCEHGEQLRHSCIDCNRVAF